MSSSIISNLRIGLMGTVEFDARFSSMRVAKSFIVYPLPTPSPTISVQSDKRMARIDVTTGTIAMAAAKERQTLPYPELLALRKAIAESAGPLVGKSFVKTDNSGAAHLPTIADSLVPAMPAPGAANRASTPLERANIAASILLNTPGDRLGDHCREFDDCFENSDGAEVIDHLVSHARSHPALFAAIQRTGYGAWLHRYRITYTQPDGKLTSEYFTEIPPRAYAALGHNGLEAGALCTMRLCTGGTTLLPIMDLQTGQQGMTDPAHAGRTLVEGKWIHE